MSITISEDAPIIFVHDTLHNNQPLSIFFDKNANLVEIIYNKQSVDTAYYREIAIEILKERVFPHLTRIQDESKSTAIPINTTTSINPAEALRREVEQERLLEERLAQVREIAWRSSIPEAGGYQSPSTDETVITKAVCDRCPVACKVDISHTPSGKFLGVTGNACQRGVGFAQDFLLEKFA